MTKTPRGLLPILKQQLNKRKHRVYNKYMSGAVEVSRMEELFEMTPLR